MDEVYQLKKIKKEVRIAAYLDSPSKTSMRGKHNITLLSILAIWNGEKKENEKAVKRKREIGD